MRYVLLLLTLLTAGFSVWYYQNRISPEGKELAAQKTTLEQEAAILEKAVIQSREKLDDAQDATRIIAIEEKHIFAGCRVKACISRQPRRFILG